MSTVLAINHGDLELRFPGVESHMKRREDHGKVILPALGIQMPSSDFLTHLVGAAVWTARDIASRPRFLLSWQGVDGPLLECSFGPEELAWIQEAGAGLTLMFLDGSRLFFQPTPRWAVAAEEFAGMIGGHNGTH